MTNALDGAGDAARAVNKAENLAKTTKAVGKAEDVGDGRTFYRYMSVDELKRTEQAGTLRPGKPPKHYFTTDVYDSAGEAMNKLSLPKKPEVRVTFRITNDVPVHGPKRVEPHAFGGELRPGGGIEYWTTEQTHVEILQVFTLKP